MGYACPVCDTPQQDGEHLANHLAFTAMTHGDDHEAWLDEHVPEWSSSGTAELAPRVAELAEEAPYETVFEDTVHDHAPGEHGHGHDHGDGDGGLFGDDAGTPDRVAPADAAGDAQLDADAQGVFEEARELTRQMLADDGREGDDESGDADADSADADADAGDRSGE